MNKKDNGIYIRKDHILIDFGEQNHTFIAFEKEDKNYKYFITTCFLFND